jgi:hypothetical protein
MTSTSTWRLITFCWPERHPVLGRRMLWSLFRTLHSAFPCVGVLIILRVTGRFDIDWKLASASDYVCYLPRDWLCSLLPFFQAHCRTTPPRMLISVACMQSQQSQQSDSSLRTRTMLATDGLVQSLNLQTCALSSCSGCKWPLRRTNHGSADTPLAKTVTQTEKYLGDIFHAKGGNILLQRPSLLGNIEFCSFSGIPNLPSRPQRHSLARITWDALRWSIWEDIRASCVLASVYVECDITPYRGWRYPKQTVMGVWASTGVLT